MPAEGCDCARPGRNLSRHSVRVGAAPDREEAALHTVGEPALSAKTGAA